MGSELEIKLRLEDKAQLERVLAWEALAPLRVGEPYSLKMETTYFDTPAQGFSSRRWTVRRRLENGRSVFCVKTPREDPASLLRGEWEVEADDASEALRQLAAAGAPAELPLLAKDGLTAVCGARFLRRAQLLQLEDGTRCELAADEGLLFRGEAAQPLCELELELKGGNPASLFRFGALLAETFSLTPEKRSKFARARAL